MSVETWIDEFVRQNPLGAQASRVVQVLNSQPRFASYATARDLADRAGVNISTVTRTAQGLGFSGWSHLQLELRNRYLGSLGASEVLTEHADSAGDPVQSAFQQDADNIALAARTVDVDTIRTVADTIRRSGRTLIIASGSFLAPGIVLAHMASFMGIDITCDGTGGTIRVNQILKLQPGDCLLVVNVWRLPREILAATQLAKDRGVTICVITDQRSTPLASAGDHVVIVPSEGASLFPSMAAALTTAHAIAAEIAAADTEGVRAALAECEEAWHRLDLMEDQPIRSRPERQE
ncbi:MurR/RpiR family transcriptional regulator [Salinifilum ghardaiensis]